MATGDGVLGDILPDGDAAPQAALAFLAGKVKPMIKDESGKLSNAEIQDAVASAIEKYSAVRPAERTVAISGNGTHNLDLPEGWLDEFSSVVSIEYPVGQIPAELIDADDYCIHATPSGKKLRLTADAPPAEAPIWLTYTVMRDETTVPVSDVRAIVYLAAALCFEQLANRYVDTSDPTIAADVVNYRSKSSEAAARAKSLRKLYNEHVGYTEDGSEPAASVVTDLDLGYPGGGDRLTHPRRPRERR